MPSAASSSRTLPRRLTSLPKVQEDALSMAAHIASMHDASQKAIEEANKHADDAIAAANARADAAIAAAKSRADAAEAAAADALSGA